MRDVLERALDDIRPSVLADGGDIELVGVNDGVVQLRLHGNCRGCAGQQMTLSMIVEPMLKERVPGVRSVVVV